MEMQDVLNVAVIWRGNNYVVEINPDASLKELGHELQKLTDVKEDTMRLIVPRSSKLLSPFSDEHSSLSMQEASITEGKAIRMMGATEDEVSKVQKNTNADLRIAGFQITSDAYAWFRLCPALGSAIGFRLDSLLKLTETRARNNKMTLMHYLCKILAEKLPELLDFYTDQLKFFAASKNDGLVSANFCAVKLYIFML